MSALHHGQEPASAWVTRWSHLLPTACSVLDVACGHGRHMRHFALTVAAACAILGIFSILQQRSLTRMALDQPHELLAARLGGEIAARGRFEADRL